MRAYKEMTLNIKNVRLILFYFLVLLTNKKMSRNILKHIKCRNTIYPGSSIERFPTSDHSVEWEVSDNNYNPHFYESPVLLNKPWADVDIQKLTPKWNSLDGSVNRISFCGNYKIVNKYPLNPFGRTGIIGRGLLGRYGYKCYEILLKLINNNFFNLKSKSCSRSNCYKVEEGFKSTKNFGSQIRKANIRNVFYSAS